MRFSQLQSAAVGRLSTFLFLCFGNTFQVCHGTYYRSFTRMDSQDMNKIGADMGRNTPFTLQYLRLGAFSG